MQTLRRQAAPAGAAMLLIVLLAACQPEPGTTAPPSASSSTPTTAAPTESATNMPDDQLTLPDACEELYSPDMLALLQAEIPPLDDPGTTMRSTENADALAVLEAAEQTIRCSWGPPSERGISTNVTVVTPEQRDALFTAFEQAAFSAEDLGSGTLHTFEQQTTTPGDELVMLGETHYIGGDAWIATRWIQYLPEGYTQDIVASLWG